MKKDLTNNVAIPNQQYAGGFIFYISLCLKFCKDTSWSVQPYSGYSDIILKFVPVFMTYTKQID